ncbi:FtsB family cell division protein [Enterococcus sp. LJL99]
MVKKKNNMEKVAALDNEYTKEQYAEFQEQQKQLIFRRRRLAVVFFIAFVVFLLAGIQLVKDYQRLNEFKVQEAQATSDSLKADQKMKKLEQEVALLNDEDYVAKLARSRYFYSKEGESIYTGLPDFTANTDTKNEQNQATTESQSQPNSTENSE